GVVRQQECHRVRDLNRQNRPPDRLEIRKAGLEFLTASECGVVRDVERRVDESRAQRVCTDTLRAEVQCDGLGQGEDGTLAGGVGRQKLLRADRVDRPEVDDGTTASLEKLGDRVLGAQEYALDVDVEGLLVVL